VAKRPSKTVAAEIPFPKFPADLQIDFWSRLQQIRTQCLSEALTHTVRLLAISDIDSHLQQFVGNDSLQLLAATGIRGEVFFPVPVVLAKKPQLIGYYRLLYGLSQKEFYRRPFACFKSMEEANSVSPRTAGMLPALCESLNITGKQLLSAIQPISAMAVHELQLLTLVPQWRGSQNVSIGQGATKQVFALIRDLVSSGIQASTDSTITVQNAAGRTVQIAFLSCLSRKWNSA
jgi:hypothetical protein